MRPDLKRRAFLRGAAAAAAGAALPGRTPLVRMPALFIGHGSPMNAIEDNAWSRAFRALAAQLPRPKAILAVSAHWYLAGTRLGADERPRTIHDFGGFPDALFAVQYPAPGDVDLARRVVRMLGEDRAALSTEWGLDHGTWSVLTHLRPEADVPVVQLSLDQHLPAAGHLDIGRALEPLRDDGVLVLASGNITHNLRHAFTSQRTGAAETPDWARRFDAEAARAAAQRDGAFLARALATDDGRRAHPSPDHYLPLLYAVGASGTAGEASFPIEGFDMASLSMRAVLYR